MAKSDTPSDMALVERFRDGDRTAFGVFVQRHQARIMATIAGMLGADSEVEDVAQETFIRFYQSLEQFRGDAVPGTYLTRIAMNLALNVLKRRRSWRSRLLFRLDDEPVEITANEEWDPMEAADRVALVQKALGQLDPNYRAVIVLRMMEGYSTKETADILRVPLGTVLSRLSRGQERLRRILGALTIEHSTSQDR